MTAIDYHAIAPVLVLAGAATLVLLADLVKPRAVVSSAISLAGALGSLVAAATLIGQHQPGTFCTAAGTLPDAVGGLAVPESCSYVADGFALLIQVVVLASLVVVVLLSANVVREGRLPAGEFHFLLLSSAIGMLTIAASRDLLMLFVSLEVLSVPAFALAGLRRRDRRSTEAALKYLLVSVVATAVTLFGISLVYGVTGSLQVDRVARQLADPAIRGPVAAVGVALTLVGFAFKISAVPFHSWAPDTYQGSPLPVAALLSTASKAAGFAGLITVCFTAFSTYAEIWGPVLAALAAVTMTVGNLVALQQRQVVRLLAWSSIAQAGYILVPLGVAATAAGRLTLAGALSASLAYLAIYAVMNIGAFACVAVVARTRPGARYEDFRGLVRRNPLLAVLLGFFLACLAGAPPGLAGLFAKVVVFKAAVDGHLGWLAVVMAVNTVIALAYYLRLAALLFAAPTESPDDRPDVTTSRWHGVAMALPALGAIAIGFAPALVLHLTPFATFA